MGLSRFLNRRRMSARLAAVQKYCCLRRSSLPTAVSCEMMAQVYKRFVKLTRSVVVGIQDGSDGCSAVGALNSTFVVASYMTSHSSAQTQKRGKLRHAPLKLFKSNPRFGLLSHSRKLFVFFVAYPGTIVSYATATTSCPPLHSAFMPSNRSECP